MYLKRNKMAKTWPLPRKGTKYLVRTSHNLKNSVPLLIVLRDMLNVVKTRKEAKKILMLGNIKINHNVVREEKAPLSLFDILDVGGKTFKIVFKNKKFSLDEVEGKDTEEKIVRVKGKKILKKGKLQVNLNDGRSYLTNEKVNVGDSVVIDLKENKIKEILPLKSNSKIMFLIGKHSGEQGLVEKIDEEKKTISVKLEDKKIDSRKKSLMVIR